MLEKTDHDRLVEIHAVLLGTNGQGGVCRQVEKNTRNIFKLWISMLILAGSIGGGSYGIIHAIVGG